MTAENEKKRVADKFRWLDQVGADPTLTLLCFRVAYAISTFVNRTTGDAWPSQSRLAADCNTTDRAVRDAITRLRDRGHMEVTGKGGRGKTSRFRPIIIGAERWKSASALLPGNVEENFRDTQPKPGRKRPETRKESVAKRGSQLPTNPLIEEPIEEPIERKSLAMTDQSDFETWWDSYPKKVDRRKAERLYAGIIKSKGATADELLAAARRYAVERGGQDPKYTKHPTTWLNAGSWLDEPQPAQSIKPASRSDSMIAGMRGYLEEGNHGE